MENKNKVVINFYFYNYESFNNYRLKFTSNNEEKIIVIDRNNFIFELSNINFSFSIFNEINENKYNIKLENDYENKIIFFLNKNLNLYNLDILIKKIHYHSLNTILQYMNVPFNIDNIYNTLNISKLFIFNIDLDFNIFLNEEDLQIEKEIIKLKNKQLSNEEEPKSLLNKKRNLEISTKKNLLIKFNINKNDLNNEKNLRFCVYTNENFPYITIHIQQKEKLIKVINCNKFQLNKQEIIKENTNKINDIANYINDNNLDENNLINYINKNLIDFENYHELEKIIYSKIIDTSDKDYDNNNYNEVVCYLYLNLLKSMKLRLIKLIKIKSSQKYLLKFIKSILNKFSQFEKYENYITNYNENNNDLIKNLKLHKNNLNFKEKCRILSTILTLILQSPFFKMNTYIEFYQIDLNKKNIYYKIKEFIFKIIDNCDSKSLLINGLEMLFSPIMKNINHITNYNKDVFSLEMKSLETLKE